MPVMKQAEIRKNGYKALIDSLGIVGMVRFLQQPMVEGGWGGLVCLCFGEGT
jgi:hypothetical protein